MVEKCLQSCRAFGFQKLKTLKLCKSVWWKINMKRKCEKMKKNNNNGKISDIFSLHMCLLFHSFHTFYTFLALSQQNQVEWAGTLIWVSVL